MKLYKITLLNLFFLCATSIFSANISKQFIQQFLPSNPIILEAGAHVGVDTVAMAKMWPDCTIYAFEPVPKLFKSLKLNTLNFPQVHCFDYALSDKSGQTQFYVSSGASDGSSSLLPPKEHLTFHPNVTFNEIIDVKTVSLDDWAKQNNIEYIDFMWLDMQGAEYLMLQASKKIFPTIRVIYTEISLKPMYEDSPLYPEFRKWLESEGFKIIAEELIWEDMGNVLFVRD